MRVFSKVVTLVSFVGASLFAADPYQWESAQVDDSAQLLTLFSSAGTPLVSVLRDNLGSPKITYVWLLTDSRPSWRKSVLSAVPFFYFHAGKGSGRVKPADVRPLINLGLPQRSVVASSIRGVLQWTVLDPLSTPVRASSRAYQANHTDAFHLRFATAESYLQDAPAGYLTETERDTIIARLDLRSRIAGDFVNPERVPQLGEDSRLQLERVRQRNWELLRQCADKTGLLFQPIDLAGTKGEYAMLLFPAGHTAPPAGAHLAPIWKLLNIKDVYADHPPSAQIPLAVYSLTYPKQPLLLIDFRNSSHVKRKEVTQRAINEITSGVIGISHFTNWYYFVAADVYDFYVSRRGTAMNQQERLNCYAKFKAALALDRSLDRDLRLSMQQHLNAFSVNPLETSPENELQAAKQRYALLKSFASDDNGKILSDLEKNRRRELLRFEQSKSQRLGAGFLHYLTFGLYTKRATGEDYLARLARYRQVDYNLALLDRLESDETAPEVAYNSARISAAVSQLADALPDIESEAMRAHVQRTIQKLRDLSNDEQLRADCRTALESVHGSRGGAGTPATLR